MSPATTIEHAGRRVLSEAARLGWWVAWQTRARPGDWCIAAPAGGNARDGRRPIG